jgi:hypothetical protein
MTFHRTGEAAVVVEVIVLVARASAAVVEAINRDALVEVALPLRRKELPKLNECVAMQKMNHIEKRNTKISTKHHKHIRAVDMKKVVMFMKNTTRPMDMTVINMMSTIIRNMPREDVVGVEAFTVLAVVAVDGFQWEIPPRHILRPLWRRRIAVVGADARKL